MKSVRFTQLALLLVFAVTLLTSPAHALLKAVGAVDPVHTVPKYYLDTNNLALTLCTDQNGFCILPPPFDPALPPMSTITTTGPVDDNNFPGESFYYSAEALLPIDGDTARLTFVIEAAFLGGVMPDGGIVFLRTDLVKMQGLTPNSTYRVTHPYGTFNFTTDNVGDTTGGGGVAVRLEDTAGGPAQWLPPGMKAGTVTGIGPYLTRKTGGLIVDPISGHTYIGDAATPVEVVGSPTGNNFFRVERILTNGVPVSGISWQTDFFVLMGRVYTDPIPSELSVSATYARDAVDGQVDIFATALPGAVLNVSGTGITAADLTPENPATGKYFLNIPLSTPDLPSNLVVSNSLDLQSHPPHPITLVDEVNITEANYNQSTNVLTIKASSRDKVAPFPTLTAANFTAPGNSFDSNGVFTKTLTTIPPQSVTVTSSKGGSATAPVSVGVPDPLVITTAETLPDYTIGSLYNQLISASGGVPPYTWSSSVSGTLPPGINFFASTGRLFGTPTSFGTYSFSLQVSDSLGAVTIKPFTLTSSTPPNPVAVADTASTTAGSTVVINVVANDTSPVSSINPATLSVSAATGGSAVANLDGTVSYIAPASAGTYSFTYNVKDNGGPALVSNSALVSIDVIMPPLTIVTGSSLPAYTLGAGVFDSIFVSTGGAPPYAYAVTAGATPPGLTAFSNGQLWGVPTTAGTYNFTITVTDNAATTSSKSFSIVIAPATPSPLTIISNNVLSGYTLTSGTYDNLVTASGGTQPYVFATTSGTVPPGLAVYPNGQIWGIPTTAGTYNFTVTVTDADLATTSKTFSLVVTPPPLTISTASSLASYTLGSGVYDSVFTASGGIPPYTFASTAGIVPSGLTVFSNGQLWGVPDTAGSYDFTVTVTDSASTSFNKVFTVIIQ